MLNSGGSLWRSATCSVADGARAGRKEGGHAFARVGLGSDLQFVLDVGLQIGEGTHRKRSRTIPGTRWRMDKMATVPVET